MQSYARLCAYFYALSEFLHTHGHLLPLQLKLRQKGKDSYFHVASKATTVKVLFFDIQSISLKAISSI
jgi:hypothetical protein